MKSVLFSLLLISLASCGGSSGSKTTENQGSSELITDSAENYSQPSLNFHNSVTIDDRIAITFEDMTINPKEVGKVLGDRAFYVSIDENVFPSYYEMSLGFYNSTKVNNVFYFDVDHKTLSLKNLTLKNLTSMKLKEIQDVYKDRFVWGKKNLDNSEYDMREKGYVFHTEEVNKVGRLEYKAHSTYLIWFECAEATTEKSDLIYTCGRYNLKFNYKLLDYVLTKK